MNAGVSLVSDDMDPTVLVKPDGTPRWPRPASQPLDEEWSKRISKADPLALRRGSIVARMVKELATAAGKMDDKGQPERALDLYLDGPKGPYLDLARSGRI